MKKANAQSFIYIVIGLSVGMMGHFSYEGISKHGAQFFLQKDTMVMFALMILTLVPLIAVAIKNYRKIE